jgi:IMP dehydrogenase
VSYISLPSKIAILNSLTYDDLLILPNFTNFNREEVVLESFLSQNYKLKLPVISSPMDTVTESKMAICMAKNGGLGVIHRNLSIEDQALEVAKVKILKTENSEDNFELESVDQKNRLLVGAAVGVGEEFSRRIEALAKEEVDVLVIDTAHGHTQIILDSIKEIKQKFPNILIMAGNVATGIAAQDLIVAGADILRVGIGPGSICTTRIVTGVGVPQATALDEVVKVAKKHNKKVVADGGVKQIGDIAKALALGADFVMLGSLLAGFDQSPGDILEIKNKGKFKSYRGMGSEKAMRKGAASRYGQRFDAKKLVAEGVEGLVDYKGDLVDFLYQIKGGLTSSFYYSASKNLSEFYQKTKLVKINTAAIKESHPHSIKLINSGESYFAN